MENEITRVESLVANQGLAMAIAILLLVAFIFLLGFAVNEFKKSREESKIVREQERDRDEKRHQEYIQIIQRTTQIAESSDNSMTTTNSVIRELKIELGDLRTKVGESDNTIKNGFDSLERKIDYVLNEVKRSE